MNTIRSCSTLLGASGFAAVLFVVLPSVAVAVDDAPPPKPPISPDTGIVVTVERDEHTLAYSVKTNPKVAVLNAGDPLTLTLPYGNGLHADVDFLVMNGTKGPFPVGGNSNDNPVKGHYTNKVTGHTSIPTQPSVALQVKDTFWKYEIVVRDAQDHEVVVSDPMVIFK